VASIGSAAIPARESSFSIAMRFFVSTFFVAYLTSLVDTGLLLVAGC
jgi:hypothetical protein